MEKGIRAELEGRLILRRFLLAIGRTSAYQRPVAPILAYSRSGDPKPLISLIARASTEQIWRPGRSHLLCLVLQWCLLSSVG